MFLAQLRRGADVPLARAHEMHLGVISAPQDPSGPSVINLNARAPDPPVIDSNLNPPPPVINLNPPPVIDLNPPVINL
jgi:hypothetical protein